jgi:hypothetical protein
VASVAGGISLGSASDGPCQLPGTGRIKCCYPQHGFESPTGDEDLWTTVVKALVLRAA